MNAKELKLKIQSNEPITIIDIREPYECENGFISEVNIPLSQFMDRIDEIPSDKTVLIYCNTGKRSRSLKFMVEKIHSMTNIHHLQGGYSAWEEEVLSI
ncbi:rhodanese-like domain-containing protein [bacterium]|jgi:rhodanese-related sulfurtransferase|nr:rhodanese-like domain-containing protein [bacterium]MDB2675069.1 rhodanese-like domain-containing protein [Flavobacteriales bacterium]